jgi:uncharacterized cupredoxin-like copper-binding protein
MRRAILLVAVGLALVAGGCGGDDDETTTGSGTTDTIDAGEQATTLGVSMTEFKFTPANPELARGKIEITATNKGKTPHELLLLKTNADPSKLPKHGDDVSEKKSVGEIPPLVPGESAAHTFDLKPGKYVMVCNVSGHYDAGMYGSLTVR